MEPQTEIFGLLTAPILDRCKTVIQAVFGRSPDGQINVNDED